MVTAKKSKNQLYENQMSYKGQVTHHNKISVETSTHI